MFSKTISGQKDAVILINNAERIEEVGCGSLTL
jgi:hypothetical protein